MRNLILVFLLVASLQAQNVARMLSGVNYQTGTTYAFVPADTTRVTQFNNGSAVAVTLPAGTTNNFGAGAIFSVRNSGTGTVTITCSSCTINGAGTLALTTGQSSDIYSDGVNYVANQGGAASLPAASGLGQVPTSTGAGTTYVAQTRSGPINFYALDYGVTANAQVNGTVSFSSSSSTINCTTCNFTSADVGKIIWAVGQASPQNVSLDLNQTTISVVNSSTQVTVAGTTSSNITSGTDYLIWGTDDTTGLTNAWNAATAVCGTLQLPAGIMLTQTPQLNTGSCAFANFYHNVGAIGQGKQVTFIVPTPNFNFTNCAPIACFQGVQFGMYRHFAIWGANFSPSGCNSTPGLPVLSKNNGGFTEDQDHSSWCSNGASTATGFLLAGGTPGSYQGGVEAYGSTGVKVAAQNGATDNFVAYGENIGLDVAGTGFMSRNSYYNGIATAVQVENGSDWTSVTDELQCSSPSCQAILTTLGTGNAYLISMRQFNATGQNGPMVINGSGTISAVNSFFYPVTGASSFYTGSFLASSPGGKFIDLGNNQYNAATAVARTPTFVQQHVGSSTSSTTCANTLTSQTTPGSMILAMVNWAFNTSNVASFADTESNTYTQQGATLTTTSTFGAQRAIALFYVNGTGSAASDTVTATITGGTTPANMVCQLIEFTGQASSGSPFDLATTNTGSGTSITPGATLQPAATSEIVGLLATENGTPTFTLGGSLTGSQSILLNGLGNLSVVTYGPIYSSGTFTLTGTYSTSQDWAGIWYSIKPSLSSNGTVAQSNVFRSNPNQTSSGPITIGSGTSISATQLCSTAQCPAGRYRVDVYINVTTACTTTGSYIPWLGYTDDAGAKTGSSTTTFFAAGGGLGTTPATSAAGITLVPTSTTDYLVGSYFLNTTGVATSSLGSINYGTTATACGTGGPMVGKMYFDVTRLE